MMTTLYGKKPIGMDDTNWEEQKMKAMATIRLCIVDDVMYHVINEKSLAEIWMKLESRHMSKSLMKRLYLKQKIIWS